MLARIRSSERVWQTLGVALLLTLATFAVAPAASAQPGRLLDGPRAAGIVGERYDGYAVIRGAAPPDVRALVDKVNAERSAIYADQAVKQHAPIFEVGRVYADQILKTAPRGTWFLAQNGEWTQK
jgi:uncharacterized protein YdbL (DUF1318 family)